MKRLLFLSLLFSSVSYGNPSVTKGTDIKIRKVLSHHQVTSCRNDDYCKINSVTSFDRKDHPKIGYYGECTYSEEAGKRYTECKISSVKKTPVIKVVHKRVFKIIKKAKKNRVQLHVAHGPNGLKKSEDNNKTSIKERLYFFVGLQYTRLLNDRFSIGATIFTNKSASVTMGVDY